MSEETQGTAAAEAVPAPEAPEVVAEPNAAETPAAPEASDVKLAEGRGKHAAATRARQRGERIAQQRAQAEAARERALEQPRKPAGTPEGGEFTQEGDAKESATPEAPTAEAAKAPKADSQVATTATDTVPDGWVDIPVPEGHPLRDRGKTHIRALKEQENEVRSGINAAMKLRDAERRLQAAEEASRLAQARQEVTAGNPTNYDTDPRYVALFQQIEGAEGFGKEMAAEVKAALDAARKLKLREAEDSATAQLQQERAAQTVASQIETEATSVLGVWAGSGELGVRLQQLIPAYYKAVDERNAREGRDIPPSPQEFFQWLKPTYLADPRVRAEVERIRNADKVRSEEEIRAKVRRELEEEQRRKAQEAADKRAALPPTSRVLPPVPSNPSVTSTPKREPPPNGNYREAAKARIRERFAGMRP